ncbi:hypothetical protein ACHFCA_29800 [Delftia tsuruhatensis]
MAVAVAFFTASALGAAAFLAVVFLSVGALVEAVFFAVAIIFSFVDLHKTLRGTGLRSDSMRCGVTHRNEHGDAPRRNTIGIAKA